MKKFEQYFQDERGYLRALQALLRQEKPPLADSLNEHDPDIARVSEGFAFLTARQRQKIDDAYPEITEPLLQRLHSQMIKGIPATSIMQFEPGQASGTVPADSPITTDTDITFMTTRPCQIEPLAVIRREMTHQANETRLTLTFQYTGKDDHWPITPINLYLSPDERVADTLMLALTQHAYEVRLYRENGMYPMDGIRFEPYRGTARLVLASPQKAGNWAPQLLMESLYLPHAQHFIQLTLPTTMQHHLSMTATREFTVAVRLSRELDVTEKALAEAFHLYCVPVINQQEVHLTVPFAPDTARYRLPLSPRLGLMGWPEITLEQEPDEEINRGDTCQFSPDSGLTGMDRYPDNEKHWFYSLETREDALDRVHYDLVFRDSRSRLMVQPPARTFLCRVMTFDLQPPSLGVGEMCYADETLADAFQITNLTPPSAPYPPITNSHHYWTLLSHYSVSPFLLYSADALRHLLRGYDVYSDTDRPQSRALRRQISGIVDIHSESKDWLIRGMPHRCLFVELTLDETAYTHEGEALRFANTVFQFLPFCLTQDMHLLMTCRTNDGKKWVLSRYPVQGYRPLM